MARTVSYDQLRVSVFDTVTALAAAAADDLAAILRQAIAERGTTAAIFATGNAQLACYQALQARDDIAWELVTMFHVRKMVEIVERPGAGVGTIVN
jgi:glucosamine-6-phosphate deaminase